MTVRQYYVAAALQGVLANPAECQGGEARPNERYDQPLRRRVTLAIDAAELAMDLING